LPDDARQTLANRPPGSDLSRRELQILQLILKGRSDKGSAEATVKWHVNIILSRQQVSDRTQAAVTALDRGIVEL